MPKNLRKFGEFEEEKILSKRIDAAGEICCKEVSEFGFLKNNLEKEYIVN